jgi:hypothetical protein
MQVTYTGTTEFQMLTKKDKRFSKDKQAITAYSETKSELFESQYIEWW